MNISIKLNNIQDSRRNHFQRHSLETIIYWVFKFQKNLCAVLSQTAWRLRHSNKRRCANIELRSEAKHCSSLCSQSELQCWRRRVRYKVPPPSGESYAVYSALKGWMFKIPKKLCAVFNQIAWRLRCCPWKGLIFQDRGLPLSPAAAHRFSLLPL